MLDLMIRNARLEVDKPLVDIGVQDGKIVEVRQGLQAETHETIDAGACFVTPPFVESHVHLDTALTAGEPRWNESGTLFEGIERWSERKAMLTEEDVVRRATKAIEWQVSHGILHIRSHVDVCDPKLTALRALIEVRRTMSPFVDIQLVAFPQDGILGFEGGAALVEEAMRLGADAVGGIPHYELTREDGVESLKIVFALAEKYGKLIDVHCDEIDDEQSRFVEVMSALALRTGLRDRVTASHTTAMHSYNGAYASKLLRFCLKSGINFVANPLVNIHLQGRFDTYPKRRGLTRVKEMTAIGINVSLGHDDILDPWYPMGCGNMLDVAHMAVHVAQMTGRDEMRSVFHMVTDAGARTLHVEDSYGIEVGKPADLVVLDAQDELDALRRQSVARIVLSKGKVIARTTPAASTVFMQGASHAVDYLR
jgi:cytosine/creatinine deaminase